MIYTTCRYAPMELFAGFGEECERLDPCVNSFSCGDSCGHPNLCSFIKAMIEMVVTQNIKELVITDCCDASRRAYDILKAQNRLDFLYFLPLPHKRGEKEIQRFAGELQQLAKAYETYCGKAFDVTRAMDAYQAQKKRISTNQNEQQIHVRGAHGGKVLLEEVREIFQDVKVVDDTCSGNRYLSTEEGSVQDFFSWYGHALLNQAKPCMRMWYHAERSAMQDENIKGMILHTIKFCDYYHFEYMDLKDDTCIPLLKIETDTTPQSNGQLKTRLQAFQEELGLKKIETMKQTNQYVAGIDSGSASTDAVIMDQNQKIIGKAIVPTGAGAQNGASQALQLALQDAGLSMHDLGNVVTTGYGRETIGIPSVSVTEITCHARGANYLYPSARTVIDIGGQDSKVIRIDENGAVQNFVMNDKCAAGTGRFLEMQARALGMSMTEMVEKGQQWKKEVSISSMCTVFAESEVVSLVAQNIAVEDIIHGLNRSIASKTSSLVNRLGGQPAYIMTGGVAQNTGVVKCLEEELKSSVYVSEDAQICGAIGAALIALGR